MVNALKNINRQQWISDAAYYKAVARGSESHDELDDWLVAEQDYLIMLNDLQHTVSEENGTASRMGLRHLLNTQYIKSGYLDH